MKMQVPLLEVKDGGWFKWGTGEFIRRGQFLDSKHMVTCSLLINGAMLYLSDNEIVEVVENN